MKSAKKIEQLLPLSGSQALQGQREKERRPSREHILAHYHFVITVTVPIVQVIENLKSNTQMPTKIGQQFLALVGGYSQAQARIECGLERGCGLEGVDFQCIERCECLFFRVAPQKFAPLTFGQLHVCIRQSIENIGRAVAPES